MDLTPKQKWALNLLTDSTTKYIGYGGGAGGGKSYVGCYWFLIVCNLLPESKWFIGRDSLKDTRESVLFTFRKVSKELGFTNWRYSENHIYFDNGSEIEFLDLSFYPQKDPLYERFGSKEYTGGWIEEAGNVHSMAFEVLKTRVGRWYNTEFELIGKILVTFNPKKNWLEPIFYRPFKNGKEAEETKFIPALAKDNPYLPKEYIETLKAIRDKSTRERLLNGNFDYDDDPDSLINYESISNIWENSHIGVIPVDKCIICDVARYGSDKALILVWFGLVIVEYHSFDVSSTVDIQNCINAMRAKHGISASRTLADDDGVGGGVVDNCRIVGFKNNGSAIDKAYNRIKDECGYKLAEKINDIYFQAETSDETKSIIEAELAQLKTYQTDKDGKMRILPKEKIKEQIGRSPDWLDCFIMRMYYFLFNPEIQKSINKKVAGYF